MLKSAATAADSQTSRQIATRSTTGIVTDRVGSTDASEILIDGGHVGIVVGR
jgi:hypothetical protein